MFFHTVICQTSSLLITNILVKSRIHLLIVLLILSKILFPKSTLARAPVRKSTLIMTSVNNPLITKQFINIYPWGEIIPTRSLHLD